MEYGSLPEHNAMFCMGIKEEQITYSELTTLGILGQWKVITQK